MKLISLWEPWASLMALGVKRNETRSWPNYYRGWMAIQASKGGLTMAELEHQCWQPQFRTALEQNPEVYSWMHQRCDLNGNKLSARRWQDRGAFPFGKIVAVVKVVDCVKTEAVQGLSEQEREFGNYESGRFAWITDGLFRLPEPIPFTAKQGLCDVPPEIVSEIRRQWVARPIFDAAFDHQEGCHTPLYGGPCTCAAQEAGV